MITTFALLCVCLGATIFAVPNMSRPEILFGVRVPLDFRRLAEGRRAIWVYRLVVGSVVLATLCAIVLLPERTAAIVGGAGPMLIAATGTAAYLMLNRKLAPFSVQPSEPRQAELSDMPEKLPWFSMLSAGPFAVLALAAAYLHVYWERIPARFPVHWGVSGTPDRWADRTVRGVYGPLLFGAGLCVWMMMLAFATWYGARRSRFRRVAFGSLVACQYLLGFLFASIAIKSLVPVPLWIVILGPMFFTIGIVIWMTRAIGESGDGAERTPEECWKAGLIYYNPNDAALFVEKRFGLGYTLNFGNRWSWVILLSLAVFITAGHRLF